MSGKKSSFFAALFCLCALALQAGDSASFVDLGFSPDGRAYMFGQYGVQSKTLKPWAELFVVDVPRNNFVAGGKASFVNDRAVLAGQDGAGALYRLVAKNAALADANGIDYCNQGQPLYVALDDESAASPIDFRDFESGAAFKATIVPYIEGSGANLKSSFYINLEKTGRDGARKSYTVGTPSVKRPLVASYKIKKVMIAPRDGSIIFVIEMKKQADSGYDIRYMVEAARL
jgi:predicted secreted protein